MRLPTSTDLENWAHAAVMVGIAVVVWGIASVFLCGAAALIITAVKQ